MIDDTVLVVDADQDTEEKIVSTLETEGYLVFTASVRDISSGMAEKINPSLIYLKPTSSTIEGFEVCKTIHNMEQFKNVPIILLASIKGPLDVRYTSFYGIVDYLKMPVSPDELIEKTGKFLGSGSSDLKGPKEDIGFMEEKTAPAEGTSKVKDEISFDMEPDESEIAQPNEEYSYKDEKEEFRESLLNKSKRRRPDKSGLLTPFLVVMAAIVILAGGFLLYKLFISKPEIPVSVAVKPPKAVQQQETAVVPPPEQQKQEQPPVPEQQKQKQSPVEEKPAVKKEAPKVAPGIVVPAAKVTEKPFFSVQLGAFKSEASAEALVKTYKGKGYNAFTHKGTAKNNETVYRVLIDKLENRKEALQLAGKVQSKEKIKTTVFSGNVK